MENLSILKTAIFFNFIPNIFIKRKKLNTLPAWFLLEELEYIILKNKDIQNYNDGNIIIENSLIHPSSKISPFCIIKNKE